MTPANKLLFCLHFKQKLFMLVEQKYYTTTMNHISCTKYHSFSEHEYQKDNKQFWNFRYDKSLDRNSCNATTSVNKGFYITGM